MKKIVLTDNINAILKTGGKISEVSKCSVELIIKLQVESQSYQVNQCQFSLSSESASVSRSLLREGFVKEEDTDWTKWYKDGVLIRFEKNSRG